MELGTVLGVFAHPDDETYLTAGLMADSARRGTRVACVTATRGEAGSQDEERWPTATLGQVREAELLECLRILGVDEHAFLDYVDGTCDEVDHAEGVERVRSFIEDVEPDTVLTFGPDGMTDHPDHKAVSAWTTDAFEAYAKPGAKLYYATTTPEWADQFVEPLQRFNVYAQGGPPITPRDRCAIYFELPADLADLKWRAINAHVSQVEAMFSSLGEDLIRRMVGYEMFRLGGEKG